MTKDRDHADDYGGPLELGDLRRRRAEASRRRMRKRGQKTIAERIADDPALRDRLRDTP